jgi:hypothetical protein
MASESSGLEPFHLPEPASSTKLKSQFLLRSCLVSWSLRFAESILLPDGGKLTTLHEAIARWQGHS